MHLYFALQKKKSKEKYRRNLEDEASTSIEAPQKDHNTNTPNIEKVNGKFVEQDGILSDVPSLGHTIQSDNQEAQIIPSIEYSSKENVPSVVTTIHLRVDTSSNISEKSIDMDSYKNLNDRLQRMTIPTQSNQIDELSMLELEHIDSYLQSKQKELKESHSLPEFTILDNIVPTAPIFNEQTVPQTKSEEVIQYEKPKVECMVLDEAIRVFSGTEMAAVKDMSEREEAEVEAGPNLGPEHPLVDLLSTFR